jgi:hypothetical protein
VEVAELAVAEPELDSAELVIVCGDAGPGHHLIGNGASAWGAAPGMTSD